MPGNNGSVMPDASVIRRVAARVRHRREALNRDQDLRSHGGPSRATVGALETQGKWPKTPRTRSAWAMALDWEADAFDRLIRGEEPIEINPSPPPEGSAIADQIEEAAGLIAEGVEAMRHAARMLRGGK